MTYCERLSNEFNDFYERNKVLFALACETEGEDELLKVIENCSNIIFNKACDLIKLYKKEN